MEYKRPGNAARCLYRRAAASRGQAEQLQQQIRKKTLPYLKHNTWLVTDAQGVQYILCEREAWGVCPMTAVTAAALAHE